MRSIPLLLIGLAWLPTPVHGQDKKELAGQARAVLHTHCYRCHGEQGTIEGGFNYLLDRQRLVARKKIAPGEPTKSALFKRILLSEMPPEDEKKRPSDAEVAVLKQWIAAGAPDFNPSVAPRPVVGNATLLEIIDKDLAKLPAKERRWTRYFTLVHLYNAGLSEDELETHRQAVSKLINSLSWGNRIAAPTPVDEARTVLRIDLRHYKWTDLTWRSLQEHYPFGLRLGSELERRCQEATQSKQPYLRGDWFVAVAALPPLYHDLLRLPRTDRELEKELNVNVEENLKSGQTLRAGFNGSGVSRNNRLIERHPTLFGSYWKSYDFASNTARQNLFALPLGPDERRPTSFQHDGGEIIFTLPNGLQGYLLVTASGQRIDKGPTEIVSDPRRPDRAVVNGLSCMSCHARGIIPKDDQVRPHVEKNRQAFQKEEVERILALYPQRQKMQEAMAEDAERFRKAVEKSGCRPGSTEPIAALTQRFEAEVDLALAAGELGLSAATLKARFERSQTLGRNLGPLALDGGTVQRDVFTEAFAAVVRDLELGAVEPVRAQARFRWTGADRPGWEPPRVTVTPVKPMPEKKTPRQYWRGYWPGSRYETPWLQRVSMHQTGHLHALALSPQERGVVAVESKIGVISVYDHRRQSMLAYLEGHTSNVLALDFAPDGRLLASGSMDQTARLWNLESSEEQHQLAGHAGVVGAVRFAPDGQTLATGSERVRLWDVSTGREKLAFERAAGWIDSLAFSPDGKSLATGGKAVQLWDVATGKSTATVVSEEGVRAIALSPDGRTLAYGQANGTIRLWDVSARKERGQCVGHTQAITGLVYSPNGKVLVSCAGSQGKDNADGEFRAWDPDTGRALLSQTGHRGGATCVAVGAGGKVAGTVGPDGQVWNRDLMALGRTALAPFEGHTASISAIVLSADGKHALSSSQDQTARLWDVATGKQLRVLEGHGLPVIAVALSSDGRTAFTSGADKTIRLWDLTTGKQTQSWEVPLAATELVLSADGKTLVAAVTSSAIRCYDVGTGDLRLEMKRGGRTLALSPDGRRLVGRPLTGGLSVWETATGKEQLKIQTPRGNCWQTLFSPDGKFIAAALDKKLLLYDAESGKEVQSFTGPVGAVRSVQFCAGGTKIIASTGEEEILPGGAGMRIVRCRVYLWDRETGQQLKRWDTQSNLVLHLSAAARSEAVLFATRLELGSLSLAAESPR